ncbi:hypothetical protein Y032_0029g1984 [Ancylostoma ceylanicum]|uniref:Uncharacterized protein n=1 Tax=Ancylostoma ceylanicum TaxID=53326 RepID=A0A016USS2_9BILA|nr:hypothetical protein Y032_0029g1984 [Ancylostoma ceylanicum]
MNSANLVCHVLRAGEGTICKVGFDLDVSGKRPKGRPKHRWLDTLHADLKLAGIHPDQAHDRAKWRQRTSTADPATKRDKRCRRMFVILTSGKTSATY